MRISDCPQNELLLPTEETFGYRWVYSDLHLYIVTIKVNGMYCKNLQGKTEIEKEFEYLTEDWTIVEIRDAIENKTTERITGKVRAYFDINIDYFVGNHITGEPVYFCISIEDFKRSQSGALHYLYDHLQKAKLRIIANMIN